MRNADEQRERCKEIHQPTVGVSSAATASKSQMTPLVRRKYTGETRVWWLAKCATGLPGSTRDALGSSDYHVLVGAGGTDQRA